MEPQARKTVTWISVAVAVFVTGTAIFTGNPGLFILAGLSAASALGLLATKPRT